MFSSIVTSCLLAIAVGFIVTILCIPIVAAAALRFGAIDLPGARRVHKAPIPRAGGVAIFIGFHLACAVIFLPAWTFPVGIISFEWWYNFLIVSLLLLLVGIFDDVRALSPMIKLTGQVVAALAMFAAGVRVGGFFGIAAPLWIDLILTVFWFVAIINAFNLIDGYDGVATGLAAIAALGIGGTFVFRHLVVEAIVVGALIAALLAFLRHNISPARIFLGDSGSMFLGFTLAALTLSTAAKGTALIALGVPLLALGVPVFDTFLAVWRRLARRALSMIMRGSAAGIMTADLEHVHHRLMKTGLVPRNVAASLYLINAMLVLLGLISIIFNDFALGIFAAAFVLAVYLVIRYVARVELWESGLVIVHGLDEKARPLLSLGFFTVLDLIGLAALLLVTMFAHSPAPYYILLWAWALALPVWVGIPLVGVVAVEVYRRYVREVDCGSLMMWVLRLASAIGVVLSLSMIYATNALTFNRRQGVVFFALAFVYLVLLRLLPRLVRDFMGARRSALISH